MVNLFDLNVGMAGNRLLTDKPHRDGLPLPISRSHVARMSSSSDQVEDQVRESEMRRNCSSRKSNGTPMKALIALEMSKEADSNRSPTNVVAKLMGLEALPQQQPSSATQRSYYRGYPPIHSDIPMGCWEQQNEFFQYAEPNEYKDVYEIQQCPKTNCARDKSPLQARYDETIDDRKIAVLRQKFNEAKRLSTDEKLRQSKQFQDALDYLNSNKDLFLKSMQESNPVFSPLCGYLQQSIPPPETKRITILRPKMVNDNHFSGEGNINEKKMKGARVGKLNGLEKCHPGSSPPANCNIDEHRTQPTRIIVLKPSPVKSHIIKATGPSLPESPRMSSQDFFGDVEDDKNQESREIAKAITQQMREKLGKHRRDETLLSSVFSNGYAGDGSSFNKSEIEYAAGDKGDSEVMSPLFMHSWDCDNRYSSPYYSFSFSRASNSPHSSVCKEAKKRLSERWALMASNGSCLGQKHMQRSTSTLGEMLAFSETKKAGRPEDEGSSNVERRDSDTHFISDQRKDENVDNSPRNLLRSKSVPVSSAEFATRLNVVTLDPDSGYRPELLEEATKRRSVKTSLKGTVASLFFSKNKKDGKDKSNSSESHVECCSSGQIVNSKNESLSYKMSDCLSPRLLEPSSIASSPNQVGSQGIISPEAGLSIKRPAAPGNLSENHDQPSPISVLDSFFEKEEHRSADSAGHIKPDQHGLEFPVHYIKSNLIDKSPPIGSIARTLSWDDMRVESSYHSKPSFPTQTAKEEEGEWFFFVQTLLTAAGLIGEVQSDSFLARWHSSESPLDPSLRDYYIDFQDKETLHEAKLRQKRSTQKLVFDCVNAALLDIAGYGLDSCLRVNASLRMVDQVWARISSWISGDFTADCGDDNDLLVAGVVRNEVVGKGWVDCLRLEMDNLEKEIEGKLLEDLVQEAVEELTNLVYKLYADDS